jgi:hypothetical protein
LILGSSDPGIGDAHAYGNAVLDEGPEDLVTVPKAGEVDD